MSAPSPGPLAPPVEFTAPWQLRAYVIAVALIEQDIIDGGALDPSGDDALRSWLSTVQQRLVDQGFVSVEELDAEVARQVAIAAARDVH
ncbi:MAG: hypothetical protein GEU74_11760 [Nitriliruptorales bacterium]|nr:hypothetical protein [Nitriliruptorales bacterium]